MVLVAATVQDASWGAVGSDHSADAAYSGGWSDGLNGGTGFDPWELVSEATDGGYAGFFVQSDAVDDHGIDNIGQTDPDTGSVWASYANKGDGVDRATAFRGLSSPLDGAGDTFSGSMEHGFINGSAGVALRTGNETTTAADFSTGARAQFYFAGGGGGYTIEDAAGAVALDGLTPGLPQVPFTFFGVDVDYTLTGADTYDITITKYNSAAGSGGAGPDVFDKSTHAGLGGRSLAGTGVIESIALFQQDTENQSDAFFNKLAYSTSGGSGVDDASDSEYTNYGWESFAGGGTGFGFWEFASETDGGYAGAFWQNNPDNGVDNIGTSAGSPVAPDGAVWASYANKGNYADKSSQYRDFNSPLSAAGDSFSVSFENGFVDPGGKVGVSLRDRAVDSYNETPDGFSDEALFQFYFQGGDGNYTLVDATGEVDTGVAFSFWGIDLDLTMTSSTTYDLAITRYGEANDPAPAVTTLAGLTFASTGGDGTVESLAFFNVDAPTQSDVFFNNLSYENVTGTPGDFDGDGDVDGGDFILWQQNTSIGLLSDWQNNFGWPTVAPATHAVPEPTGLWLVAFAWLPMVMRRNKS